MTKKVLDVGQCGLDHPRIKRLIESSFDATVHLAHTAQEANTLAASDHYDLILVNRLLDTDHSSGVALIESLKASNDTAGIPVMLVSNFPDAQNQAIDAGAVPGFGKNSMQNAKTLSILSTYLADE